MSDDKNTSRYENDFIDMGLIASGGFGNVYLAENKLTGVKYAVKCVIMKKKSSIKHCVNEVKIISRYNHPNIVAFNSAWIEGDYLDEEHVDDNETDIETDDDYCDDDTTINNDNNSNNSYNNSTEDDSGNVYFEKNSFDVNFCKNDINIKIDSEEEVNDDDDDDDESRTSDSDSVVQYEAPKPKKNYLKLYIQMELCKNTLEEWMNKRTEQTSPIVIEEILLQLLNALDYIHKKDAVHHDIKPSNIFIDTTEGIQIKLGDFGLACFERQKNHPAMGTQVYAAPEQLQGQCDPKSDIYSVGIILFELLFHIPTAMERSNYITLLKQGKFDDDHHKKYPEWCDLIKLILQNDPTKRPSAKKLLQQIDNNNKNKLIQNLRIDNLEKTNIITKFNLNVDNLIEKYRKLESSLNNFVM
ncbi:hypothetical protein HCN44_006181 [Aphidius gifuensis]|uniref:Protein kinase domain-containing protein n=1 Tax=Aphidius gifuensis TaxID=684658 RepID=A0A835CYG1_APHGI|nr:hypothetical protein HCN44_006181 [Aphidius gifuensis]